MDERVARYLDHVRFEKRLAERTSTLYALDLQKLAELALAANVDLAQVQTTHVRRWVAQMHSAGHHIQAGELRHPQTAAIQQLHHGGIARFQPRVISLFGVFGQLHGFVHT